MLSSKSSYAISAVIKYCGLAMSRRNCYAQTMDEHASAAANGDLDEPSAAVAAAALDDLSWAVTKMRAGERIVLNQALFAAYRAASSPHSFRALKSDLEAFDLWCCKHHRIALPASPETVADYLDHRAAKGARPASLARYKASVAKIHHVNRRAKRTPYRRPKGTPLRSGMTGMTDAAFALIAA